VNAGTDRATRPVIGLTGGIGAGKSEVARIFAELGCIVVNSDDLARQALHQPEIRDQLRARWGDAIFDGRDNVDRSALAKVVFADPRERAALESIIHPWIEERRRATFAAAGPDIPALVIDAPLLLEAGIDRECTHIIFVDCPRHIRLERVRRSRGWSAAELERREAAQFPLDRKRNRADTIIVNDGDLDSLREQVCRILLTIVHADG